MLFRFLLAILLASQSVLGSGMGWKKNEKRKSMRIQLPTILSSRRHSDEPATENSRPPSVTDRVGESKVSFEQPNVNEIMEKLQTDAVADCGRSNSQSDSSGSSQPAPVMITLLPTDQSQEKKKRGLFRKDNRKKRANSTPNESAKLDKSVNSSSAPPILVRLESPRSPVKDDLSGSSQSSNIGNRPSNEDFSGNSQSISPDTPHRQLNLAQSSLSDSSQTQKRRMYRAGRQGSASTSAIKKIEPIRVKRVGSAANSPRETTSDLKKVDLTKTPEEEQVSESSSDISSEREKTRRCQDSKHEKSLSIEIGENLNLQLLIEQLVTTTTEEQELGDKPKVKRKPTRKSMKRRSVSMNSAPVRPPAVNISLAPDTEDHDNNEIGKLIAQLNQNDSSLNRRSTQRKRQRETLDSSSRLMSPRGRSGESSPRKGGSRSQSRNKRSPRSKSRDSDINLMIESLKNSEELVEVESEQVPEPREIKKLIKSLKSSASESKDEEEQAAILDCLNSLKDFQSK